MHKCFLNTNTNTLGYIVECKYVKIVNNKKNIQHYMQKQMAKH